MSILLHRLERPLICMFCSNLSNSLVTYFRIDLNKFSIADRKSLADFIAFSASSLVEKKLRLYWSSCLISRLWSSNSTFLDLLVCVHNIWTISSHFMNFLVVCQAKTITGSSYLRYCPGKKIIPLFSRVFKFLIYYICV